MLKLEKIVVTAAMLTILSLGLAGCERDESNLKTTVPEQGADYNDGIAEDVDVTNAVAKALQNEDSLRAYMIQVETRKGDVMLIGTVDTEQQRMLAEQVALNIPGVRTINNEINVKQ